MSTMAVNPYASPDIAPYTPCMMESVFHQETEGLWRDGNLLVIAKGTELPNICLKTNEPTDSARIVQRFTWTPGWILAVVGIVLVLYLPLGLFLCMILSPFVTQRVKVRYPASANLYRRWKLSRRIGWNTLIVAAAAFVGVYVAAVQNKGPIALLLLLFAGLVVLVGAISRAVVGWRLKAKRITKHYIWVKGVHPDYLRRLPELPMRI